MEQVLTKRKFEPPKWMYPIIYNKWKIIIGVLLALILLIFVNVAFCESDSYYIDELGLGGTMIADMTDFGQVMQFKDMLSVDSDLAFTYNSDFKTTSLAGTLEGVYNVFLALGSALVVIFWSIGFYDMIARSNNQLQPEQIVRKFLFLVVGILCVANAKTLVGGILNLGAGLYDKLALSFLTNDVSALRSAALKSLYDRVYSVSSIVMILRKVSLVVDLLVPWLLVKISNVGIILYCFKRYFEICIVYLVSPVALADSSSFDNGIVHSNTFRALKQVFALALEGLLVLTGIFVCSQIAVNAFASMSGKTFELSTFTSFAFGLGALYLARLGIVMKAQQLAKQTLGV